MAANPKILLVEDDPAIAGIIADLLEDADYEVDGPSASLADGMAAVAADFPAGAVLDVTQQEPLPSDSPLWDIANLVITPHDSGDSPLGFTRTVDGWLRNLTRYVRAEPLEGVATSTGLSEDSARRRELGQA